LKSLLLIGLLASALNVSAQTNATAASKDAEENAAIRKEWESWNAPFEPFRVIGNIYYVGPCGISSFLITTPAGHILLDTGFEMTVPRIRDSVRALRFRTEDIKIILNSHAHLDHAGGDALMKQLTGAKIFMCKEEAALLADGGTNDFTPYSPEMKGFRPAHADRILQDGDQVKLGGTILTCHLTPGHTKGCMTWTMDVLEEGQLRHVVFFGSTSLLPGVRLLNNPQYPQMVDDFRETYRKLKALPCDVFLAPHPSFFNMAERFEKQKQSKTNPFVDTAAFKSYIGSAEQKFLSQLEQERK
jgi:metallo-beta-lactamase class B